LNSIESALGDFDEFNYDKGMALAALSRWSEAEKYLLKVTNPDYTRSISYTSWLPRCYVKNHKSESAWRLYQDATTTEDAKSLLMIIASECYNNSDYLYAMKAYEVLSKVDFDPSFRDGLIAASVGVFRGVLSKNYPGEHLGEVILTLNNEPEAQEVLNVIQNYLDQTGEYDNLFN
jgi:intraflagellar transport protein 56